MHTALEESIDEYMALVRVFPLVHIRDDAHLNEALAVIDRLIDQPARSKAEEAYLDVLTDVVEKYEDAHVEIPRRSGLDTLRFLMEVNDLKQDDLAPLFGAKSIVSEVLNEKRGRKMTLEHIRGLARRFGVPADVFIDE
jgi:HTH-type transcriptional regulator/antitoxin HigA